MWITKPLTIEFGILISLIGYMNSKTFSGIPSRSSEFKGWSAILLVVLIVVFVGSQVYLGFVSFFER